MAGRDLFTRLADAGEEAIGKLAKAPGGEQAASLLTSTRDRLDEMQRKIRGLDALEARVVALERRVDALQRAGRTQATASRTGARKPAARARSAGKAAAPKSTPPTPQSPSTDTTGGGSPG